jgi:hypothetical protein
VLFCSCPVFCQDILFLRTGEELKVKVLKIKPNVIRYKLYEDLAGPELVLKRNKLMKIQDANGKEYTFQSFGAKPYTKQIIRTDSAYVSDNLYLRGQQDARLYYHSYEGAQIGTIVATVATGPLFGLASAAICSSASPAYHNLGFPDYKLMQQAEYAMGYRTEAHLIKSKKVWKGYSICALVYAALTAVVLIPAIR